MTRVQLQNLETTGATGEVFIRDTAAALGGAWGAAGGGGGTFFQQTATFSGGADSVTITVADAGVGAASKIVASVSMGARATDELELAPVVCAVGNIVPGVSFDVLVVSLDGDAEGDYIINVTRD